MSNRLGPGELFQYNAKFKVLICRECKYAIQKSALESHLLRHKIYRGDRRRLLSFISRLALLEPDDVQDPPVGSLPVDWLPVIPGFRCTATDCENLCASSKRMRRHWSENHSVSDPPSSFARSASLQTFFRGTKVRYFEVASPVATARSPVATPNEGRLETQQSPDLVPTLLPQPSNPPFELDLETLRYFHHFTTETSLTLPAENDERVRYWQTDVVAQALQLRWLMCGLLAISASHMAVLSEGETTIRAHQERSRIFLGKFSTGWAKAESDPDERVVEETRKAWAQMVCILRCCRWASESPITQNQGITPEVSIPFHIQAFITTVQGCADPNLALHSVISGSDETPEQIFVRASKHLTGCSNARVSGNIAHAELLQRLHSLPFRMRDLLGRPDNVQDVFAMLSAVETLVECCSLSYASDDRGATWSGMESWLGRLSDHFRRMVLGHDPVALVVLAHWSFLVERVERYCWFLSDSSAKLRRDIVSRLEGSVLQRMVEDLLG